MQITGCSRITLAYVELQEYVDDPSMLNDLVEELENVNKVSQVRAESTPADFRLSFDVITQDTLEHEVHIPRQTRSSQVEVVKIWAGYRPPAQFSCSFGR